MTLPIRLVHARYGKRARAEPVAALYEQGRVIHCGAFAALEEELMAMGLADGRGVGSLDRADALVWAVTDLLINGGRGYGCCEGGGRCEASGRRRAAGVGFRGAGGWWVSTESRHVAAPRPTSVWLRQ